MSSDSQSSILRSCPSNLQVKVIFLNCTNVTVSLEWIDYNGQHKPYHHINPRTYLPVNTYVGHPWVAYGVKYRYQLLFSSDRLKVYFPSQSLDAQTTAKILILSPLLTLETLCIRALHQNLRDEKAILELCIPPNMKEQLKLLFINQKNPNIPIKIKPIPPDD